MKKKSTEKDRNLQQIPFRLHVNDHKALKMRIISDGLKIQTLVEACIVAYINGDDHIKNVALSFKDMNTVSKKDTTWSTREQEFLLDEIESMGGKD